MAIGKRKMLQDYILEIYHLEPEITSGDWEP